MFKSSNLQRIKRFWIFSLTLAFVACEYEPGGEYSVDVSPPDSSDITVMLGTNGDTVGIGTNSTFNFEALVGNRKMIRTNVFMNEQLATVVYSNDRSFIISNPNYPDGLHRLTLEVIASAGTGSLADARNKEEVVVSKTWVAIVDKKAPTPCTITSITTQENITRIEWKKYERYNFQSYILQKLELHPLGSYLPCWTREINNRADNVFYDPSYAGGKAIYKLTVKGADQLSTATQAEFTDGYEPTFSYEWTGRDQIKLTWQKPKSYAAVSGYKVMLSGVNSFSINNAADTSLAIDPNIVFGFTRSARLTVLSKGTNCVDFFRDVQINLGETFPSFSGNSVIYNKALDKYFATIYDANYTRHIIRISASMTIEQSYQIGGGSYALSENGQFFYLGINDKILLVDPLNFQVKKTYNLFDLESSSISVTGNMTISNTNVLGVVTGQKSYVLDMSDYTILYKQASDFALTISPSGTFLFSAGKIWQRNGSSFSSIKNVVPAVRALFNGDKHAIVIDFDKLFVVDLASPDQSTTSYPAHYLTVSFDAASGLIGAFNDVSPYNTTMSYYLIDPALKSLKEITVGRSDIHTDQYTLIANNKLICTSGRFIPLSYFY